VPHSTRSLEPRRWLALLGLLGLAWLVTPHPVPLYDGIGFPDEPYRYVPARAGAAPATIAQVQLKVAAGSNVGGLIANSAEVGPQVSVYAPPHAFAAAGTAPLTLTARPVPPSPPLPSGTLDSNVYALSVSSPAGPVTVVAAAQPPAITMRAATVSTAQPVFEYRPGPTAPWQELKTRQVGRDIFNANAPGAGEYVLVKSGAASTKGSSGGRGPLYAVIGATALLMILVLVGVRLLARRAAQPAPPAP
jgi:hypothetical protein